MDYINTVTCPRVQKVMERKNIDDSCIYFELAKWNETAKKKSLLVKVSTSLSGFLMKCINMFELQHQNQRFQEKR